MVRWAQVNQPRFIIETRREKVSHQLQTRQQHRHLRFLFERWDSRQHDRAHQSEFVMTKWFRQRNPSLRTSIFFFLVATPERSHPFPSRTRKLSSPGPMVLQGQLCGSVGRCRGFEGPLLTEWAFIFFGDLDRPTTPALDRAGVVACARPDRRARLRRIRRARIGSRAAIGVS